MIAREGARQTTVPLRLLERVIVQGSKIRLEAGLLGRLGEAGVVLVILSPRHSKRVAYVTGTAHNEAAIRLAQASRVMDGPFCDEWAASIVKAKTTRQMRFLQAAARVRPDIRKPLFDAVQQLTGTLDKLEQGDSLSAASLRGIEGQAARAYFAGFGTLLPPSLAFTGRNRRPPRDPVNACLSLGYTLLHHEAVRACHTAGLDPWLGFFHRRAFGRESLASDLIEPLRPTADRWVWEMFRERTLRDSHFHGANGACLLGKAGREVFYKRWETDPSMRAGRLLRGWTARLARIFREAGSSWVDSGDSLFDD